MTVTNTVSKIILAEPRGFCAGVNRAIDIVNLALEQYGTPLYVRHEIVHNHHVVNDFKSRGVIFIEQLDEVPDNSVLIFSAHGTSPNVIEAAKNRGLRFVDAVCPLVTKVHLEIAKAIKLSKKVLYIGHRGHQEVLGAMGYAENNIDQGTKATVNQHLKPNQDIYLIDTIDDVMKLTDLLKDEELVVATQTTLSLFDTAAIVERLKESFTKIQFPKSDDICYATTNRQEAVTDLVRHCDRVLIIGSENSSNTLRLLELAQKELGNPAHAQLVPNPDEFILTEDLIGKRVGISSGASAPETLVQSLIAKLIGLDSYDFDAVSKAYQDQVIETLQIKEEKVNFPLPKELRIKP